jgi:hypothetical protein
MMNRMFRDDGTERSSVKNKQKGTKNRNLGDTIHKLINRRHKILNLASIERPKRKVRFQ